MKLIDAVLNTAEETNVGEPWFKVLSLPNDVFAIHEPKHWQSVISFLIVGSQKSILFDTGMGIKDISEVVRQLTDLEVIVVNSHTHFDHIGDNHRFARILVYDDNMAVERLQKGWSNRDLQYEINPAAFVDGFPDSFNPRSYEIQPVGEENIYRLQNEDVIDIGNRTLQVLHTPGHSPDSIMLLDRLNRSLFTGDTFYPDWIFAFLSGSWGESNLQEYYKTIRELTELVPELDYLYCSHVKALADPKILHEVAKAFEILINKSGTNYEGIEMYGQDLIIHHFDGFSIVTKSD
jgi:glyoxylase-like metal-dependent hydrolase (beta-lactamase superfamily II)